MKPRSVESGAATLVVVMVMFLIVAMLAAYANRNLVFEQRVSSNYARSAVAHEAAEAGLEWGIALLNGGKIDASCAASATGVNSLRQRYLGIDAETGWITPQAPLVKTNVANCVKRANAGWQCQCPDSAAAVPSPSVPADNQLQPSFSLQFEKLAAARSGVVRLLALGCSDWQLGSCSGNAQQATANALLLSGSQARVEVALLSALKLPPAAPLVSRLELKTDAQGVGLHSTDPRASGLLLISGAALPTLAGDRLDSLPDWAVQQTLRGLDPALQASAQAEANGAIDAMFKLYFGMPSAAYRLQPAMKRISCEGDCAQTLSDAYAAGARMLWVEGDLQLSSNVELGTDTEPVVLVAAGAATLDGPMRLHGLLYARKDLSWGNASGQPALLSGAAIVEGSVKISGRVDFLYLPGIMNRLNKTTGSFVRVPGSWSDVSG